MGQEIGKCEVVSLGGTGTPRAESSHDTVSLWGGLEALTCPAIVHDYEGNWEQSSHQNSDFVTAGLAFLQ